MPKLDYRGHEVLDPTSKSINIPFRRPEPLHMRLRRMIQDYAREQHEGYESFEDADDFDVGDDLELEDSRTPYEQHFDYIGDVPEQTPETQEPATENSASETEPDKNAVI